MRKISKEMSKKKEIVDRISRKLKKIMFSAQEKKDYELMMETIEAYAFIYCSWNQIYMDSEMENALETLGEGCPVTIFSREESVAKTVVFHDGFAVDMWSGLAYIYISALLALGYRVIHLSNMDSKDQQPKLKENMRGRDIVYEYYCMGGATRLEQSRDICRIINKYKPEMAFLYISPWDTASVLAYSRYQGVMKRFFINATDHTFWVGHNAFDVCVEFRNFGANVSIKNREIDADRVKILPYYPVIDSKTEFEGFPFNTDGYKIVFSGGAPYKTIDANNTFFSLVETMLGKHSDVIFVYAPKSDELNCKEVQEKYPDRFYLLEKRKDLYQVLRHSYLYLGTYPFGGGLMTQYAVQAGRFPLVVNLDSISGILKDDVQDRAFYKTIEDLEKDMDLLLEDSDYLREKEELIKGSVISKEEFQQELNHIIHGKELRYPVSMREYNLSDMERTFRERFDFRFIWNKCILRDEMRPKLLKYFPVYFIKKEISVAKMLCRRMWKGK